MVFFKAEANNKIGGGHLSRSLILAEKLEAFGVKSSFVFSETPASLIKNVKEKGFETHVIEKSLELNALTYTKLIDKNSIIVFDTDNYLFYSGDLIEKLHKHKIKTACFTITDKHPISTNLLINPNIISETHNYNKNSYTMELLGPKYMVFNKSFNSQSTKKQKPHLPFNLLLIFGNADVKNLTLFFLQLLPEFSNFIKKLTVIAGSFNKNIADIKKQIGLINNIDVELFIDVKDIEKFYTNTDLAITSAGMAMWEMALFEIPLFVFASSNREDDYTKYLDTKKYIQQIGFSYDALDKESMYKKLYHFFNEKFYLSLKLNEFKQKLNINGAENICIQLIKYQKKVF